MGYKHIMKDSNSVLSLFLTFFKIGLTTFGGGYAMIPIMQREFSEKRKWVSEDEMTEMIAISESTPGPLAINAATFIGNRVAGFFGAFLSTLGVILPSFFIILIISLFLEVIKENIIVEYAFFGLRAGVLALFIRALYLMAKNAPRNIFSYCLIAGAFTADVVLGINTMIIIASCAAIGLAAMLISGNRRHDK